MGKPDVKKAIWAKSEKLYIVLLSLILMSWPSFAGLSGGMVNRPEGFAANVNPSASNIPTSIMVDGSFDFLDNGYIYGLSLPMGSFVLNPNGHKFTNGVDKFNVSMSYKYSSLILGASAQDLTAETVRSYDLSAVLAGDSFSWGIIARNVEQQISRLDLITNFQIDSTVALQIDFIKVAPLNTNSYKIDGNLDIDIDGIILSGGALTSANSNTFTVTGHGAAALAMDSYKVYLLYKPFSNDLDINVSAGVSATF